MFNKLFYKFNHFAFKLVPIVPIGRKYLVGIFCSRYFSVLILIIIIVNVIKSVKLCNKLVNLFATVFFLYLAYQLIVAKTSLHIFVTDGVKKLSVCCRIDKVSVATLKCAEADFVSGVVRPYIKCPA